MTDAYTSVECKTELATLNTDLANPWELEDDKLTKTFTFSNFVTAFGFMTQAAIVAEKSNHHPEWFNVYKTVKVQLTTHDAGGISAKDFDLARQMEKLATGQR
ncbi:MAG TPA: 4a-hydroxytetrahydrobiopterin dehydratase [Marinobacter sp.]|nr:4a-hydroxytetrahydrobiopterin dehydratase [Marinobacter sp.]